MEKWKKRALELISNLALSNNPSPGVIPYYPAKTKPGTPEKKSIPRISPQRAGISADRLCAMLTELEDEMRANVHSLIVVKNGGVVLEAARPGYDPNLPHLSHSMSKTVTGILTALLFDDELLTPETKVADYFDSYNIHRSLKELTLKDLLIMSSGVGFAELGTVCEDNWLEAFFENGASFKPGEKFAYNSMNSYVIARICDSATRLEYGYGLEEYLDRRLFRPLGIDNYLWEKDRNGFIKGGWGLYLSCESWAKLGMMMLSLGKYNGQTIVSEKRVVEMISTHAQTPLDTGDFNYGYHIWVGREDDSFLFSGMLGQNVWVCPKNGIVVALNSGNNEFFQQSPALEIIKRHLGCDLSGDKKRFRDKARLAQRVQGFFKTRLPIIPKQRPRTPAYILGIRRKLPHDSTFQLLYGKYTSAPNNQGMLPIFVRAMQNNYQGGIKEFEFSEIDGGVALTVTEGDIAYKYEFGLYGYRDSVVDYNGEIYLTRGICGTAAEEGGTRFVFELIYPELPNARMFSVTKTGDGILQMTMSEVPNQRIAESMIKSIPTMNPRFGFIMDILEGSLGKNFIENKITELFCPTIVAVDTSAEDYEKLLGEERLKVEAKLSSYKFVRSLIERFSVSDTQPKEEPEAKESPQKRNPLAFLARLFGGGS